MGLIKPKVVAWEEIVTIGKDAVMVKGAKSVIQPGDDARIQAVMGRDSHLSGTQIYAQNGTDLGTFGDVYLNEDTGRVLGYEVSGGFVADTMSGKRYMSVPHERTVGDNVVIVPDHVADSLDAQAQQEPGGVKGALSAAGDKVSDAYGTAKDKVTETYSNIAGASIEKQKEFVWAKPRQTMCFYPRRSISGRQSRRRTGPPLGQARRSHCRRRGRSSRSCGNLA